MILTGQAARAIAYEYNNAALAAGASYVITQNGILHVGSTTQVDNNTNLNIEASGDSGSNWRKAAAAFSPMGFACNKNYTRVRNATGGAIALSVTGVYFA